MQDEAPVEVPQGEQPAEAPATVEAPATTEPEAQAAEPDKTEPEEPQQEEPQRDEKGRFKSGLQNRMDELTRARREAEREASYWRAVAEGRGEQQQATPKPSQDQFDTVYGYVEALAEWKADQKIAQALGKRAEEVVRTTQAQTFEERVQQARSTLSDFDQVVGKADVVIADHVKELLLDSEYGPELVYRFAKNSADAQRLSSMSPLAAAREIGRMEAAMSRPAPAPQKAVSQAPPPTRPVSTGRSASVDLAKMSMDEFMAHRRKEGASWAR